MASWSNWSGRSTSEHAELRFVRSVDDLAATVVDAAAAGRHVRVAGSGHSHFPLVPTDDVIVDVSGLSGLIDVDAEALVATVRAGSTIASLGRPLHDAGVALANQGDIDRQTVAGATATGTHGTGRRLRNLSSAVVGLTMVTVTGDVVRCSADERSDIWEAARLGLGAFGIAVELELEVVTAYRLSESAWREPYVALRPRIDRLGDEHRHFEFFWYPHLDLAFAKAIDLTDEPACYPVGPEGQRVAWSYEVLPNHRARLHTEMEFAVPLEASLECLDQIREMVMTDFADLRWPIEYRTVAADDVWLSPAYGRDVATISVHEGIDRDDGPLFRACEAVFRRYGGRPHWGKVHGYDASDLAAAHPRWHDWWARRDAADPDGVFLNDALTAWRP